MTEPAPSRTWLDRCHCGHTAVRHTASNPKTGVSHNMAGPCGWCHCPEFAPKETETR